MEIMVDPRAPPLYRDCPMARPVIPLGLEALYTACRRIYPNQPNPLQVTSVVKYWLGGPDPLDYISMYCNSGDEALISPHWHYITFGFSDLHGDGRVHEISGSDTPSGYGFELTFRLKREPSDSVPPTWPAAIMQALAKYVFNSENTICPGDHVSWHCPLDNSESRIEHMLMQEDPQLGTVATPFGSVTFIQIIGVCSEELHAAQGWNGPGVIELMKTVKGAGGPWLITDMRRGASIFELDPSVKEAVDHGIETEGSNLSGVSAKCLWEEKPPPPVAREDEEDNSEESGNLFALTHTIPEIPLLETEKIKAMLKKGLLSSKSGSIRTPSRLFDLPTDKNENHALPKESYDSCTTADENSSELLRTRTLDCLHLHFNLEAATLLPLALRSRLKHGRHFTFKSAVGDIAITLLPPSVAGAFVDSENPYVAHGPWLQVLLPEEFIDEMLQDLSKICDLHGGGITIPKTFSWPERKLSITLVQEDY